MTRRLPICEYRYRTRSRSRPVANGLGEVIGICRITEGFRGLGSVLIQLSGIAKFHRPRDHLVITQSTRRNEILIQNLTEEHMSESVGNSTEPCFLFEHTKVYAILKCSRYPLYSCVTDSLECIKSKITSNH